MFVFAEPADFQINKVTEILNGSKLRLRLRWFLRRGVDLNIIKFLLRSFESVFVRSPIGFVTNAVFLLELGRLHVENIFDVFGNIASLPKFLL